jgi:hypothetical protein
LKIFKNLKGINLKFGYQRNFGRFVLDTYVGVGVQHKIADVFGRTNLDDETNLYFESADFNEIMILEEKSENRYVPKFTMNIKVGYLLW